MRTLKVVASIFVTNCAQRERAISRLAVFTGPFVTSAHAADVDWRKVDDAPGGGLVSSMTCVVIASRAATSP